MSVVELLTKQSNLSAEEYLSLLENQKTIIDNNSSKITLDQYAQKLALSIREKNFGNGIFIRGLIEISNYCKNDCYYCGIRRSNSNCQRYRLSEEQILSCCKQGYQAGFRTFVLQGGEDSWFTDERLCSIISNIKNEFPDCAVTLSIGEREKDSYQLLKNAGADRFLLRHETADEIHYSKLHPSQLSLKHRKQCLYDLKELGYQTGSGFMVGSPFQTLYNIAQDLVFLQELQPQMIGIGPFIPHSQTPFANYPTGSTDLTLFILSILRIRYPKVLLPSTTALNSAIPNGRTLGIQCGANVVMPNLSPNDVRAKYSLYNNKKSSSQEAVEGLNLLEKELNSINCTIKISRGDYQ